MSVLENSFRDVLDQACVRRSSALHAIHHAIGRARRRARPAVRISYAWLPGQKTWYECARCGGEAWREDRHGKHCRLCGASMVRRDWVRPDVARARQRAARRAGARGTADVHWTHPWRPLPEGDYVIRQRAGRPDDDVP